MYILDENNKNIFSVILSLERITLKKTMEESAFYIFLNNNISKKRYPQNNSSRFITDIFPVIQLDSPSWEVAITSAIIPFDGFKETDKILDDKKFGIKWKITTHQDGYITDSKVKQEYNIEVENDTLIGKTPEEIVKMIVLHSAAKTDIKSDFFESFFTVYLGKIVLKSYILPRDWDLGFNKNIIKVEFFPNKLSQKILSLNKRRYILYNINEDMSEPEINTILGENIIGDVLSPPKYISIYSDLIIGNRYGDQYLGIMDFFPIGISYSNERKISEAVYSSIRNNSIHNISILIYDEKNTPFNNHTQDIILTLHFRKKK